jgi:hypothetical protein
MRPEFDACQFFLLGGDRCVVHGVNFSFANLCALRALCGLTLFGIFLPFPVWPNIR